VLKTSQGDTKSTSWEGWRTQNHTESLKEKAGVIAKKKNGKGEVKRFRVPASGPVKPEPLIE